MIVINISYAVDVLGLLLLFSRIRISPLPLLGEGNNKSDKSIY